MSYTKNTWVDQDVERPKTYEVTNNQDGSITLTDSFGLVTELGTPVNAVNMNHIEDGIDGCAIRKHNLTETFNLGEWVLGGTGDDEGIYKSLIANNVGNAVTDDTKWEKVKMGGSSRNVGEIISSTLPLTDAGLHLLDGTLLQYGIYKEFIDYIADLYAENPNANYFCTESDWQSSVSTYGVCGKFVYDSANNTVRLPKVTGIVEGTTDVTALGELVEAGLPNITGELGYIGRFTNVAEQGIAGAFYDNGLGNFTGSTASNGRSNIGFDASRSSSLYKNNFNKVQPQTVKLLYYIVIATSTKTDVQVDIDEIATDLNGKADVDLTNVTNTGYIKMAGAGMPSNRYIDLTLGASGTTYTAPADGFIQLRMVATGNTNCGFHLYSPGQDLGHNEEVFQVGAHIGTYLEVQKGQTYGIDYWNVTGELFRFIYAQGSESEAS